MNYDLMKLKEALLRIKGIIDTKKRREAVLETAKKFGCSDKTIYRHMKKRVPGKRKRRDDAGKLKALPSKKEVKMMTELVKSGNTRQAGKHIIEKEMKKKISTHKLQKITKKAKEKNPDIIVTNFGKEIKMFLEKYFRLDVIAPEANILLHISNKSFYIKREDFEDIILILTNAYNRAQSEGDVLKMDRDQMRERMLMNLFEWQIKVATETGNIKDIEMLTRIYDRMKPDVDMNVNIRTLEAVCRSLKPDITLMEIIGLLKNVTK